MTESISNRFIPTEEVRRLTVGSYEHLVARVEEAVRAEAARLFGASGGTRVVGTFPGYAIVMVEDRFFRVKFDEVLGRVRVTQPEALKVASYSKDDLGGYLRSESLRAVTSFRNGAVDDAFGRLRELVRLIEPSQNDAAVVEAMIALHKTDRSWKKVFEVRGDEIRRMVLDELSSINEDRLRIRFRSLYDNPTKDQDLESYRASVTSALARLAERADDLVNKIVSVREEEQAAVPAVASLFSFTDSLVEDLRVVGKTATGSRMTRVDCLGRLHDALAEDFHDRELAGRFVIKMIKRLNARSAAS